MLIVDEYLISTPTWAQNGDADRYQEALDHFKLILGRNPSLSCPCGGHSDSSDQNIVAYATGVMCYSQHGFIPRKRVIELAGSVPSASAITLADLVDHEVGRFVALDQIQSLLTAMVEKCLDWPEMRRKAAVDILIWWALRVNRNDAYWSDRLEAVCRGSYPKHAREFWSNNGIVHTRHTLPDELQKLKRATECSFEVRLLYPRKDPGVPLSITLAPKLAAVKKTKFGLIASPSAGTDRFLSGESRAVTQSSLVAVESIDRPVPHLASGWRLPERTRQLPRNVLLPRLTAKPSDADSIADAFLDDVRETFAFTDDEAFTRYVAYLVQPMLVVLLPGQFPGYQFSGPTHSGKTFAAGPLAATIYQHNVGSPIFLTRLPNSDYEMAVQVAAHEGVMYAIFDEAIDLNDKQLKVLDQMITNEKLVSRIMRVGYVTHPNYVTFAFTAVSKTVPPETAGRLLEIHFTESRPQSINTFYQKWGGRGPVVLRALFDAVSTIDDLAKGDPVPDRRPGFGILKRVLREAFSLEASFEITAQDDDILDLICEAFFKDMGSERTGGWRRLSFKALTHLYCESTGLKANKATMGRKVYTSLGYESTRKHPQYRHTGYRWEDGKHYDIEIRSESEGQGQKRTSIYVRLHKVASTHSATPDLQKGPSGAKSDMPPAQTESAEIHPVDQSDSGVITFDSAKLEKDILKGSATHE